MLDVARAARRRAGHRQRRVQAARAGVDRPGDGQRRRGARALGDHADRRSRGGRPGDPAHPAPGRAGRVRRLGRARAQSVGGDPQPGHDRSSATPSLRIPPRPACSRSPTTAAWPSCCRARASRTWSSRRWRSPATTTSCRGSSTRRSTCRRCSAPPTSELSPDAQAAAVAADYGRRAAVRGRRRHGHLARQLAGCKRRCVTARLHAESPLAGVSVTAATGDTCRHANLEIVPAHGDRRALRSRHRLSRVRARGRPRRVFVCRRRRGWPVGRPAGRRQRNLH